MAKRGKAPAWAVQRAIKRSSRNCTAKKVFKTVAEAEQFAKTVKQRVYVCPVCSNFHLTTQAAQ